MRRRAGAVVLAVSVIGGVATGVAMNAATSDQPSAAGRTPATPTKTSATPSARPVAERTPTETPGVEVKDPVLVSNTDGTATLSATLINRTDRTVFISNEYGSDEREPLALLIWDSSREVMLEPGVPVRIGRTKDGYWIRTRDRVDQGLTYGIALEFSGGGLVKVGAPPLTIEASVVDRTSKYDGIADNGPNPDITVSDGVVVVVPGQAKAYIGGSIENPTNDGVRNPPLSTDSLGRSVAWYHQTATGGGFNVTLTDPPYLEGSLMGEADYFLAKDVTVGETITVTFQYPSGDVVGRFTVVQGNPDGTI
ncbi:MAG: hypothetical protein ABWX74_17700 [Aeromicrobium sp.]